MMTFCSWCKLIQQRLHAVNLKDENFEQFSFSQQWVESWLFIVRHCCKLALIGLFLDFYLLIDQCSKHEFVIEACVGWKGRDTGHALLRWGRLEILNGCDQKRFCVQPLWAHVSLLSSGNSKTHKDVILPSFYYSPVEHLSDCAVWSLFQLRGSFQPTRLVCFCCFILYSALILPVLMFSAAVLEVALSAISQNKALFLKKRDIEVYFAMAEALGMCNKNSEV